MANELSIILIFLEKVLLYPYSGFIRELRGGEGVINSNIFSSPFKQQKPFGSSFQVYAEQTHRDW